MKIKQFQMIENEGMKQIEDEMEHKEKGKWNREVKL